MPAAVLPELSKVWLPGAGVRLRAVAAGPAGGPPVVLLHGFPEFWYGWRHQLGPLAGAGFRVVAPDQRGYNRSDKPPRVADYTLEQLAADVVAVLDAIGADRAAVVGHDWGGIVGWWLAIRYPHRVARLAVLNAPHPAAIRLALESSFEQLARSWYVFTAQIPGLAERVAEWTDYGILTRSMRRSARPGTFADKELARYRKAWERPGAMTGMVNWYRAAGRYPPPRPASLRVHVPTLILWGMRDQFLCRGLAAASADYCTAGRLIRSPTATHWLPHEEPAEVNRLLVEFLKSG